MDNCYSFADINEAVNCVDADNVAGTSAQVEVAYADDVTVWPEMPKPSSGEPMSFAQAGTLTGDITLSPGAKTCKLTFTRNTGKFDMQEQGEAGCESVLYSLTLERAKMNAEVLGFLNATRGRRLVILVTDKNGTKYLMGDKVNAAYRVQGDAATTGQAPTDGNKVPMRFEYVCPRHLVYSGNIATPVA